jgi:hypothetical protein
MPSPARGSDPFVAILLPAVLLAAPTYIVGPPARALTVISPRCKLTISEGSSEENEGANESGLESAGTLSSVSALVIHREFRKRMLCCFHVCLYLPVIPSRGRGEGRPDHTLLTPSKSTGLAVVTSAMRDWNSGLASREKGTSSKVAQT